MGVCEILSWQGPTLTMCKVFECPCVAMARPKLGRLKWLGYKDFYTGWTVTDSFWFSEFSLQKFN